MVAGKKIQRYTFKLLGRDIGTGCFNSRHCFNTLFIQVTTREVVIKKRRRKFCKDGKHRILGMAGEICGDCDYVKGHVEPRAKAKG